LAIGNDKMVAMELGKGGVMVTLIREAELQYLKEKRERLYEDTLGHKVEIDILTERIWEILEYQRGLGIR